MLSTADGTDYAITIKDIGKFSKLFSTFGDPNFSRSVGTLRMDLMNKFFGDEPDFNPNPIITEASTNNVGVITDNCGATTSSIDLLFRFVITNPGISPSVAHWTIRTLVPGVVYSIPTDAIFTKIN